MVPCLKADAVTMDYFGVGASPMNDASDYQTECDEIIASGVKWVRMSASWNRIEKSKGVYDNAYLATCDDVVNRLTSHGIKVLWILSYTAPWASSQPTDPKATFYKPANWTDWEDFVTFVCNRYAGKITHWEVWNEEDSTTFWKSSVADYAVLLQKASAKVRLADANNKVLIGGFTGGGANYLSSLFAADASLGSYFDIVNYHAYVDSPNMVARYKEFTGVMGSKSIADKPIWITETGYTTDGYVDREAIKADWVDQTRVTHFSMPGIDRIFWYNYRNAPANGNPNQENFGLEANDRTPLPAYYHYQGGDCAETNFALQRDYPTQSAQRLVLTFVDATSGGAVVNDDYPDGSTYSKLIPVGHYLVCRINDNYIYGNNHGLDSTVTIEVTYWDEATNDWQLQYQTAATTVQGVTGTRTNTLQWKTKSFTLTDHNFTNGQSWGGDFRLYAGSYMPLAVSRVAVYRETNPGRVVLGSTNYSKLVENIIDTNTSSAAYTTVETIGGRECRKIANGGKYFYFKVCDGLVRTKDTDITIGVRYYDQGSDNITVQYLTTTSGSTYVNATPITKTNTNTWKYGTFHLTNAKFDNSKSWSSDFRIYSGSDGSAEYVDMVDVKRN
ncbi:MAG: glycosyl hydrolase [Opitutaceae bacterium]|jgi:hypothetical protein